MSHLSSHHSGHHPHENHKGHDKHAGHNPAMFKQKFWLSLLLTLPTLYFSETIEDLLGYNAPAFAGSDYIPAIFGVIIFFYGGLVFLKGAKAELADRRPGMMTLVSLAISVAFSYSLIISVGLISGTDFWWELASLVTIMLLGHWLEMAAIMNAQGALNELAKLLPDEAELITKGGTKKVAVSELRVGETVLIRPGGQVPVDGVVTEGKSKVNEAMLTGESKPLEKTKGSTVIGGTINGSGSLKVKVTKIGGDTALAGIMKLVAEAQSSKSKTQLLADKAAAYLFYIALVASAITAITWAIVGEPSDFIFERVVTVLIIACPHALGLAIPLVTSISTSKAARAGLLIRQRPALEAARNIDVVVFDKTGTLTKAQQGVTKVIAEDEVELLAIASAVEQESEHSIAKAIVSEAKARGIKPLESKDFLALKGLGAKAKVRNRIYHVGGPQLLKKLDASVPPNILAAAKSADKDGQSVIYVAREEKVIGAMLIADVTRDESKEAVAALKGMGKTVAMLSGDSQAVARWVASELGIEEYYAEVLPAGKVEIVKQLQRDGKQVAMVGDGINDAPALAQADIGIAIGAGTDVAIESADIVLSSSDPRGVAKIVSLSNKTYRKMTQNLVWATGYNAFAIPLAAGAATSLGFVLSPALGAVLMSLSTIIVALNAQLLRREQL